VDNYTNPKLKIGRENVKLKGIENTFNTFTQNDKKIVYDLTNNTSCQFQLEIYQNIHLRR
jgi:hypothetical protein